jgi:hypothetical protein
LKHLNTHIPIGSCSARSNVTGSWSGVAKIEESKDTPGALGCTPRFDPMDQSINLGLTDRDFGGFSQAAI